MSDNTFEAAPTYGANIRCTVCGAMPRPADPATRETFDLLKIDGEWFCELHRPARKRASRPVAPSPLEALAEFERRLVSELSGLEETFDCDADRALDACRAELSRGLADLRKAIAARKAQSDAAKPKRKPSPTVRRKGQGDLIALVSDDAQANLNE
jgi:hypothetical protein